MKTLSCTFFDDLGLNSCTNFDLHRFFLVPKKHASQGLTVAWNSALWAVWATKPVPENCYIFAEVSYF